MLVDILSEENRKIALNQRIIVDQTSGTGKRNRRDHLPIHPEMIEFPNNRYFTADRTGKTAIPIPLHFCEQLKFFHRLFKIQQQRLVQNVVNGYFHARYPPDGNIKFKASQYS
jgi:hypothetical protein